MSLDVRYIFLPLAVACTLSCASGGLDYAGKVAYLDGMSKNGAKAHVRLKQRSDEPNGESCLLEFRGLFPSREIPGLGPAPSAEDKAAWKRLVERTFVASCTSGHADRQGSKDARVPTQCGVPAGRLSPSEPAEPAPGAPPPTGP